MFLTGLVGRDDELAWLPERWDSARTGTGGVVALIGPRGAGKSRLTQELARAVHAGGVVQLQDSREREPLRRDDDASAVCPFKGLAYYDVTDARYFFGRERLVAELLARLVGAPLVGVWGTTERKV